MKSFEIANKRKLYIESSGKNSCIMGFLGKGLEVWSYPVKLIRGLKATIFIEKVSEKFELVDFVQRIIIKPELTKIVYTHPLFTIEEIIFSPIDFQGSFLIYDIDSSVDLNIIFSFFPELNLMWPGSIGGQFSYWSNDINGFVVLEPKNNFSAIIRSSNARKYSQEGDHSFFDEPYGMSVHVKKGKSQKILSVVGGWIRYDDCKNLIKMENSLNEEIERAKNYYKSYLDNTVKIETPDEELNAFFEWAKISMLKGLVRNPILGEALTAGIGPSGKSTRPGFDWFFAGDMAINSFGMLGYNDTESVRKSLEFYIDYQSEDGRIPHEISQSAGWINWFEDYKGFAYLHADTTAWYLLAFANYVLETSDINFAERLKEKVIRAYRFYEKVSDADGMILNQRAGLGALEIGEFRKPKYDIYTNGIYAAALEKLSLIMEKMGEDYLAEEMKEKFKRIRKKLEDFWYDEGGFYCLSINDRDQLLKLLTPWPAFPIAFNVLNKIRSRSYIDKLKSSSIFTPWGVRSVEKGKFYDPLNYNFGSVWYFFNGYISQAAFGLNDPIFGWQIIKAAIRAFFEECTTHMPELFSGDRFAPVTTAVPIIKGLFGIEKDAFNSTITIKPQLPVNWHFFKITNLKFNDVTLNIHFNKEKKQKFHRF